MKLVFLSVFPITALLEDVELDDPKRGSYGPPKL